VGLAVYNGERYLDEAIMSIRSQTFEDIEVVICDNASTDATAEICALHAANDHRIRYYRNPVNIGGVRNENRTLFLSRGEYFKLAAHDDTIAPTFLERCVSLLDSRLDSEVCMTSSYFLDEDGHIVERRIERAGSEELRHRRIRSIAQWGYACEAYYGVMRMTALRDVRPLVNYVHSDRIVLSELALRAPFFVIDEPLFFKRIYAENAYADPRKRMAWYQPELTMTGGIRLPHWRHAGGYAAMLARSRLPVTDRLLCTLEVLRCYWHLRRDLVLDVVDAAGMVVRGRQARRLRYIE
jgi:glycosyltransferase involved in cell wall biosynthesis